MDGSNPEVWFNFRLLREYTCNDVEDVPKFAVFSEYLNFPRGTPEWIITRPANKHTQTGLPYYDN